MFENPIFDGKALTYYMGDDETCQDWVEMCIRKKVYIPTPCRHLTIEAYHMSPYEKY
jgi:hypothetical protein